jgi:RHS repeat-associated protein
MGETARNIPGIAGGLTAVQNNSEAPVLQLTNLHGDIIATAYSSETATGLASSADTSEFGVPTTNLPPKYSWLGADEVPTELASGILDMGARSYAPQIGRFLQPDPKPGGSANAYTYTFADPINTSDPSGESTMPSSWSIATSAAQASESAAIRAAEIREAEEAAKRAAEEATARTIAEANATQAYWASHINGYTNEPPETGEEEEWYEEEGESGTEYVAFGPSPHSVGVTEAEAAGVYVQPLEEDSEAVGSAQGGPLPLCKARGEGRPCGRYVCGFPMGCLKAAWHWVKKNAKHIAVTITAGISAAVIGGVTIVATVGCAGAAVEDPLLEFDCYKIGTFGATLTMTTAGIAVAPWIHK